MKTEKLRAALQAGVAENVGEEARRQAWLLTYQGRVERARSIGADLIALTETVTKLAEDDRGRTFHGQIREQGGTLSGSFIYQTERARSIEGRDYYTSVIIESFEADQASFTVIPADARRTVNGQRERSDDRIYSGLDIEAAQVAFLGWVGRTAPERVPEVMALLENLDSN